MFRILISFTHGLGDAVQLTSVFQHLRKYHPHWKLYFKAGRGKHSVGHGHCVRVWDDQEPGPDYAAFDKVFDLAWYENYNAYPDTTNSKVTNCLRQIFKMDPDPTLLTYRLHLTQKAKDITAAYLRGVGCLRKNDGRFNAAILHYQGNTSQKKKNINHEEAAQWCGAMLKAGLVPIILDWDRRSPLPDNRQIFCPGAGPDDIWGGFGSGDAEVIAALISQTSLFVGIDSGPQKCAAATDTPSIGIWVGHSPVQFFDHATNFIHLVPETWREIVPCQNPAIAAYQAKNYPMHTYCPNQMAETLIELSHRLLGANNAPSHSNNSGNILKKVLIQNRHGLGDCIQATAVIKNLRHYYPDWQIDVVSGQGKHSAYHGLARSSRILGDDGINRVPDQPMENGHDLPVFARECYDQIFDLAWKECADAYEDAPSTKAVFCLRNVFHVEPIWDLLNYTVKVSPKAEELVCKYLEGLPLTDRGFVLIHYQGNTDQHDKDLSHDDVRKLCTFLIERAILPVILDWDRRSPLPDGKDIFCPGADDPIWQGYGTGDAETLVALIDRARALVAINSGPQKAGFATRTPVVAVWTGQHPIHFVDNAPNAVHVVPDYHPNLIRGDKDRALSFFGKHYRTATYQQGNLAGAVRCELARAIGVPYNRMHSPEFLLTSAYSEEYYQQHKRAGVDYLGHGTWQEQYGAWVVEALGLRDKVVLDVGCACGSIAAGLAKAGAIVSGCDLSEHMIKLGRERWLAENLFVCDAVNLHYWGSETFDCLHSHQVAEHWQPQLVPFILKEMHRVAKQGGVLWVVLDTEVSFAREIRKTGTNEDPTHICIRSLDWWREQCEAAGWRDAPDLDRALTDHPGSYYQQYDWESFICRKT